MLDSCPAHNTPLPRRVGQLPRVSFSSRNSSRQQKNASGYVRKSSTALNGRENSAFSFSKKICFNIFLCWRFRLYASPRETMQADTGNPPGQIIYTYICIPTYLPISYPNCSHAGEGKAAGSFPTKNASIQTAGFYKSMYKNSWFLQKPQEGVLMLTCGPTLTPKQNCGLKTAPT